MVAQTFVVAMPPSTNNLYVNVPRKGRVKSGVYKRWLTVAGWQLKPQIRHRYSGDTAVWLTLGPRKKRDLDNCAKAVLDLLQAHHVVLDDLDVVDLRIRWGDVDGCQIDIERAA